MPNDTITVRVISDENELFHWIVQRMEETEPLISIPSEFTSACDTILRDLQAYRVISTPLVTTKGVERAREISMPVSVDYVDRSAAIVYFLGDMGDILQDGDAEYCSYPYELIKVATKNWPESVEFLSISNDNGKARIMSTGLSVREYGVYFDIILEDFHALAELNPT